MVASEKLGRQILVRLPFFGGLTGACQRLHDGYRRRFGFLSGLPPEKDEKLGLRSALVEVWSNLEYRLADESKMLVKVW